MVLCIVFGPVVSDIPMAALVAVMELFFASSNDLVTQFDYADDPDKVVIDLSDTHVWDAIENKYAQRGKEVEIIGLNQPSAQIHQKLSGELTGSH
jgi:SulP family sulfate permease